MLVDWRERNGISFVNVAGGKWSWTGRRRAVGFSCTVDIGGGAPELELRTGKIVDVNLPVPVQHIRAIVVHKENRLIGLTFITRS